MKRQVIVNRTYGERRIAIIEDRKLVELHIMRDGSSDYLGNVYCGVVQRVLPGMQSAFVEYGGTRTGFIHVNDLKKDITYEEFQKNVYRKEENDSHQKKSITDYICDGQKILVQVLKEPVGQKKGARLTTHISLAGRYVVLMPTIPHMGISRKIKNSAKRAELKQLGQKVQKKGFGIIMRTLSEEIDSSTIEKDVVLLIKKWTTIKNLFKKEKSPALLFNALNPVLEIIQNTNSEDLKEVILDSRDDEKMVCQYSRFYEDVAIDKVSYYDLPYPIFDYYSIEPEIVDVLKRKIWLKSGGFLIIEQTEALSVIDVNTGKFTGKGNFESTIFKTNIEAAEEVAHHLRLRNLAGIIIVDFIDMKNQSNKKKVIDFLDELLQKDPAKTSVFYFTRLGLIQITRKRTTQSNISFMTEPCPYCNGNAIILSKDTVVFKIFRDIQRQVRLYRSRKLRVEAHPDAILALETLHFKKFTELKKELNVTVETDKNQTFHREHYLVSSKDSR